MAIALNKLIVGGGKMGDAIRAFDWSKTPLGAIATWSDSLRTSVNICINSRFPMVVWWGKELLLLYNDAWSPILGSKHPSALGKPGKVVWKEIWDIIGVQLESVLTTGQATWSDDFLLPVDRYGYSEEAYFTYSYSPIFIETGEVGGAFSAVTETTQRVLGERRLATLRNLAAQAGEAKTVEQAYQTTIQTLAENPHDIPFALFYSVEAEEKQAILQGCASLEAGTSASPPSIDLETEDEFGWSLATVMQTGQPLQIDRLVERFEALPKGMWSIGPQQALILPIHAAGKDLLVGMLVVGVNAGRALDEDYRNFFDLVAGHIATAIANARAYEEERKRAEALAEIDRTKTLFFSNVSHEFRTPLTLMLAPLEDVLAAETVSREQRQQLELVHRNSLRLLKLVNTLLDFSRIEAGRIQAVYEPTDLASLTAELASVFRSAIERAGLRLIVNCEPISEPIYVDRDMWEKIVLNLLSNAFKFTLKGEIEVALHQRKSRVEFIVRDTGTGIPTSELPRLFERFHRVHGATARTHEGSGIGLALVQELVRLHGGNVGVESIEGQGSTFTVTIPTGTAHLPADGIGATRTLASTSLGAVPYVEEALRWLPEEDKDTREYGDSLLDLSVSPPLTASSSPSARILLVDDNADMRDYVKRLLSNYYEVEAVADGMAALAAIQDRLPDLVLTDVMMPRLDGFGLLRALRNSDRTRELPIILLSARAGEESQIEGLEAGADDYLIKPFSTKELLARVRATLEMAQLRKESARREQVLRTEAETARDRVHWILESITDAFVAFDRDWRYTYVNQAAAQILQRSPQELLGKNVWKEVFPSEEGGLAYRELHRAMAERIPVSWEEFGKPIQRWLEINAYPSAEGVAVYFRDISNRKRAEAAIQQSEARFRRIFECNMVPMGIWTRSGKILAGNDALLDLIGYNRQELETGQIDWLAITPSAHLPSDEYALREISDKGLSAPFEKEYIHKQGHRIPILIGGASFLDDPESGIFFAIDLTERQQTEKALRQSEERYRYLVESIPQLVWTASAEGMLLDVNQRWLDFTGLTLDRVQIDGWAEVVHSDDVPILSQHWAIAQQNGTYYQAEGRMRRADGVYRWHLHQAVPMKDERGQILKWFGTATDIEEQKQLQQERDRSLQQEQAAREEAEAANRIKDEFLAVLSHELRSPLNPILGWSSLLQNRQLDEKVMQQGLQTIERNAKLQTQLIEDLLDVSRILRGKMALGTQSVDLMTVIEAAIETVRLAAEAKQIQIQKVFATEIGKVSGDPGRLQQIVWNLLSNAIKFTPSGGRIEVKLSSVTSDWSLEEDSQQIINYAQITVSDSGKGISLEFLPYVFDYFRQEDGKITRKFGGLGLGLAIVRYITELHGGTVGVDSPGEGRGATFTVRLPLAIAPSEISQDPMPKNNAIALDGLRILVVDDEADMRDLVKFILEEQGATVNAVASAVEALTLLDSFRPDLLIGDIGMPDMDGYTLMGQIRQRSPEGGGRIPAIALTAYAAEYDRQKALEVGFQQHVAKPVEPNELVNAIAQLLNDANE